MIVWTNGCFDVLHRGHLELLRHAKSLGDVLYVGIDSDSKVSKDKGLNRPINNMNDRKFFLESIEYVDKVFIFCDTTDLEETIEYVSPDIIVIGSDWEGKTVVGQKYAKEVVFFDRIPGYSTTQIINRN